MSIDKNIIRKDYLRRRSLEKDRHAKSDQIFHQLKLLPEIESSKTILGYAAFGSEVETAALIGFLLRMNKKVVLPYCEEERLELFHLKSLNELSPGAFSILEPRMELRESEERSVDLSEVDLVILPAVAFDRCGARLGYGEGFFDRLLENDKPKTVIGLAFASQIVELIPTEKHDVLVDIIVTEKEIINCANEREKH